jgi:hypothetical protein
MKRFYSTVYRCATVNRVFCLLFVPINNNYLLFFFTGHQTGAFLEKSLVPSVFSGFGSKHLVAMNETQPDTLPTRFITAFTSAVEDGVNFCCNASLGAALPQALLSIV